MTMLSSSAICTNALSICGVNDEALDITTPTKPNERICARWYDITRQSLLRQVMPSFAITRKKVALVSTTPSFGFEYAYQYPKDCLRLLGIDEIELKSNNHNIEGQYILYGDNLPDGLPIRYVSDFKDTTVFTPDFTDLLSWQLAANIVLQVAQDTKREQYIASILPTKFMVVSSIQSQENPPIRISNSKFMEAKYSNNPRGRTSKR